MKKAVVLLPAGRVFEQLFSRAIEPICGELSLEVTHPRVQLNIGATLAQIQRTIQDADFIIADVSAANASILYAVGFAEALGKKMLLMTIAAEDFPLDFKLHEPIVHAGRPEVLTNELKSRLKWLRQSVDQPAGNLPARAVDPHSAARLEFEAIFGEIMNRHSHCHTGPLYKENNTTFVLENNEMELPLVQDLARHAKSLNMRIKLL